MSAVCNLSLKDEVKTTTCYMRACRCGTTSGFTVPRTNAAEKLTFILAHPMPKGHIMETVSMRFMKKLKELSGGNYVVQHDSGGVKSLFDQVTKGSLPMILGWPFGAFDKRFDFYLLGYLADDWREANRLWGTNGKLNDIYQSLNRSEYIHLVLRQ